MNVDSRSGWRPPVVLTLMLVWLLLPTSSVSAQTQEPATPPTVPPPAKPQDSKGESTFTIYGFAMLDAGYQFKQNDSNWFEVIRPTKLPAFPNEFAPNGKVYYGVRQSRLGVKSSTPTKYAELKTQFEFELFGTGVDAGQTTCRLRHAYGELGQFGAGQTWSPFMDITAVGYSFLDIDNSNGQTADAFHRGHYGLATLLFYPVDNVMVGGEFQWGRRENFLDGFKSDDFRIQFRLGTTFRRRSLSDPKDDRWSI